MPPIQFLEMEKLHRLQSLANTRPIEFLNRSILLGILAKNYGITATVFHPLPHTLPTTAYLALKPQKISLV